MGGVEREGEGEINKFNVRHIGTLIDAPLHGFFRNPHPCFPSGATFEARTGLLCGSSLLPSASIYAGGCR